MSHYSERVILARHHVAKGRQIVERAATDGPQGWRKHRRSSEAPGSL